MLKQLIKDIVDYIYPRNCIFCGEYGINLCQQCYQDKFIPKMHKICPVCKAKVYKNGLFIHSDCQPKTYLDGVFVCVKYNKAAKKFLHLIKYDGYYDLINDLVKYMQPVFACLPVGFDFVVPVPLHKKRLAWRGFNQAEKITQSLTWNYKNALMRVVNTKAQAKLKKENRLVNLVDAFAVVKGINLVGKRLLLIDDVFTSGSTLENCAQKLKNAGAKAVYAMTWAGDG